MNKTKYFFIFFFTIAAIYFLVHGFLPKTIKYVHTHAGQLIYSDSIKHMPVPKTGVRAVYISQCGASSKKIRNHILDLLKTTELNAVVVDVKDYSGTIAFYDKSLTRIEGGKGCIVSGMKDFIKELHDNNIYTIARITVFQDPLYARAYPSQAVHKKDAPDEIWHDYKGLAFIDVGAQDFWRYIVRIAKASVAVGFDELNFDYVRYPSDGLMKNALYTHSDKQNKSEELESFFRYLSIKLRTAKSDDYIPKLSVDLFGMTTTSYNDSNIGQILEKALPYFDYIAPMVYPSHYPSYFLQLGNPNEHVYKVVKYALDKAVERTIATTTRFSSWDYTKDKNGKYIKPAYSKNKIRPWLQDFDYGGVYDAHKVRRQIDATYDAGLNSWMLWDAANLYTREALESN